MGVVGWATLVAIDGEVNIQDGPGNVVTGTFAHISDNMIDLQLHEGEQVLRYNGEVKPIPATIRFKTGRSIGGTVSKV